ncbi:Zona pellucida-like domain protein [Aphelenchoides bicaudatus]|nr:Zona pellucida-like domain protein [Aphelenchoides bicaudatus]
MLLFLLFAAFADAQSLLDNGLLGEPSVTCMEDRLKITFRTEKPFKGRIFVKGMSDNEDCISSFSKNTNTSIDYHVLNGNCNMRRSRKLGPNNRGIEQSTVLVISFHETFITKLDRAYQCACLYREFDKIVTNRFDVSMFPTTELFDQARIPVCLYSVHSGSVNGPLVTYAKVGDLTLHKWSCESDMFAMLIHDCFVDDGIGKERFKLIDENGCSTDPAIISDLTYNTQNNMAFAEVNSQPYFQCAVSTCMISEGNCKGKTPPRCGPAARRRRTIVHTDNNKTETNAWANEMDLSAEKIFVLDPEDMLPNQLDLSNSTDRQNLALKQFNEIRGLQVEESICITREIVTISTCLLLAFSFLIGLIILWRTWRKNKI